jgi:uncharacterized delta-60 repeat protein
MKQITILRNFLICINLFALLLASSAQTPGSLDLTFDGDGKVLTNVGNSFDAATAVAIQSDGKIVVAGVSNNGTNIVFALARYTTDGSLDNTFDTDGLVTTAIGNLDDWCYSVAIQSDGKIVAAGASLSGSTNDFAIVRYNTDGSLDATFGTLGIVTTPMMGENQGKSVVLQPDGKIVVGGHSSNGFDLDFALARYNVDGSLDPTFDTDGIATTDIGSSDDYGNAIALQSDGKIVISGYSSIGSNVNFSLARFNSNGSMDNTFDGDGTTNTSIGVSSSAAYSIAIQNNGKIVVAGKTQVDNNAKFALARYNTNGSLDNTFDTDGIAITAIGVLSDQGSFVAAQEDGKILLAGDTDNGTDADFALVRYNGNGSLDNTFGGDGIVTTSLGMYHDYATALAIQSDGKIVAAGFASESTTSFALVRYNNVVGVGIGEASNASNEIEIYPNPFSSYATIESSSDFENSSLVVYNIYGEAVQKNTSLHGKSITLRRHDLPSGMYFIQLTQNNEIILNSRIIIRD